MATSTRKRSQMKAVTLRKVCARVPKDRAELEELEEDLRRMGCVGFLQHPWRIRHERVVKELVSGEVPAEFINTIRARPEEWTPDLWGRVYGFEQGGEGLATRKEDYTQGKFASKIDSKAGYLIEDCRNDRERRVLAFLVPILNPEKPYSVTLTMASTLLLAMAKKRKVNWGQLVRDLVQRVVLITRKG